MLGFLWGFTCYSAHTGFDCLTVSFMCFVLFTFKYAFSYVNDDNFSPIDLLLTVSKYDRHIINQLN